LVCRTGPLQALAQTDYQWNVQQIAVFPLDIFEIYVKKLFSLYTV